MKPARAVLLPHLLSLFLVIFLCSVSLSGEAAEPAAKHNKLPLANGTFIQLLEQNSGWSRARWEGLFASFQSIGLQQVVIQWTLLDNRAFFTTHTFEQSPLPPLATILELAEAKGIEVYLGLAAESRYWEMIKQSPGYQEEYLNRLRFKSARVAQELATVAARYKAFKGWYITEEIDDLTWRAPKSREVLEQHLKQLSGFLKTLTPTGLVLLSAFTNARMNPDSYEAFWDNLLRNTSVDVLLFQDSAGTAKLPGELLPRYLKAVRGATDANGKKLQVVVELFATISESPFQAIPAPMLRVQQQLRMAADFATGGISSFSVPEYMSPEGGAAAAELLQHYQEYKKRGSQSTAP